VDLGGVGPLGDGWTLKIDRKGSNSNSQIHLLRKLENSYRKVAVNRKGGNCVRRVMAEAEEEVYDYTGLLGRLQSVNSRN